jgi:outer membrane protein assembly factor BamB
MRIALVFVALIALRLGAAETNWPEFRGPSGDGTSTSTNLPVHWGEQQNVKWKTLIHGRA